jgi:phage shock protein PspC (stress-responsive transcriptional regulator)
MIKRPDGALLAGVCADIAARFGWNVWVLRGLFVLGLLIKTLATGAIYLVLAMVFAALHHGDKSRQGLAAPELSGRNERISELERRFRDMEGGPPRRK